MIITLIGYRGSGKSSVARLLAKRWDWIAVDADDEIERRAGKTIQQIFHDAGEVEFRRLERETIAELLKQDHLVLAAGGGAILNAATRQDMRAAGPVVWLRASIEALESRIHGDATTASRRPDLTPTGGRAEIEKLLALREPLYRQTASLTIETDGREIAEVAESIVKSLDPTIRSGDGS